MHERPDTLHEDDDSSRPASSGEQPAAAAASIQSIATQAAAAMAAAMVAQQLLASAAATCGLDLGSLSQFAIMAASQSNSQPGSQVPQTPEQLMAAAVAAATFLSHTNQATNPGLAGASAAPGGQLINGAGGAGNPLNPLLSAAAAAAAAASANSNSTSNSSLNLGLNLNQATILPEDLSTALADSVQQQQQQQAAVALKLEQHLNSNHNQQHHQLAHQLNAGSQNHLNLSGHAHSLVAARAPADHHSHNHHQQQQHSANANGLAGSLGPVRDTHSGHHHRSHPYQRHSDSSGASSANSDSHHTHQPAHPHTHHQTRHLLGHHHHSSIQTQQQLLATKGYNPLAVVVGSGQQTEILTPTHLRKAKLMFYYVRYPNSSTLKECFRDVRFNKNNTAQLVKWFSNFREFYYIQMEKFARDAINDERIRCKEDIVVTYDHELINVLNNHYNKNRHIELPEVFRQVVEETLRHFFDAIHTKRDQEQSWKKAIYKVIARLDQEVPEVFKTDAFNEHLE